MVLGCFFDNIRSWSRHLLCCINGHHVEEHTPYWFYVLVGAGVVPLINDGTARQPSSTGQHAGLNWFLRLMELKYQPRTHVVARSDRRSECTTDGWWHPCTATTTLMARDLTARIWIINQHDDASIERSIDDYRHSDATCPCTSHDCW